MIDLWFLDQSGFCPILPTGYGWGRLGRRLVVPYGAGVTFCSLPPSSPELHPIEPVWRQVTYQAMPERSSQIDTALHTAVEAALSSHADHLESQSNLPRHA